MKKIEVEQKVSFSVKTGYKKKEKRTTYYIGRFEKLFLKIAIKSIHVGGVGKLDQQN